MLSTTDEEFFDRFTLRHGGILRPIEHQLYHLKFFANQFLDYYAKGGLPGMLKPFPNIISDYVANPLCNAFASREKNGPYVIAMYEGLVRTMLDTFNRALSHPLLFQHIGDPSKEVTDRQGIGDFYVNFDVLIEKGLNGIYTCPTPKCEIRKAYAIHQAMMATKFVFEHELSHILFGHVDWLQFIGKVNYLNELNYIDKNLSSSEQFTLDLLTLEMDADCTALARCINLAVICVELQNMEPRFLPFYRDIKEMIFNIVVAIGASMRVQGYRGYKNNNPLKATHPDPMPRQIQIIRTVKEVCKVHGIIYDDLLLDRLKHALAEVELMYIRITGTIHDFEVFDKDYCDGHKVIDIVLENWQGRIRGILEPFTYRPLAT